MSQMGELIIGRIKHKKNISELETYFPTLRSGEILTINHKALSNTMTENTSTPKMPLIILHFQFLANRFFPYFRKTHQKLSSLTTEF